MTGEDGLASLTDLLPGTYVVTEIEAPPGYLLNSTPQNVYLDEGRTETMLFRNNKPGGIAVLKRDAISGLPLAGAVFELRTLDGELIGKEPLTTGLDGYIRVWTPAGTSSGRQKPPRATYWTALTTGFSWRTSRSPTSTWTTTRRLD